ncbi:MAG: ABC transporter permease [Deltaproteobacteria bacterium]|nr:ABC transporter permease [Deltaproteobacteria bacterium]
MGRVVHHLFFRLGQGLFVAVAVSTLTFILMVALPGDLALKVAMARYGEDLADEQAVAYVRKDAGLDRPWWVRYAGWLRSGITYDLGNSIVTGNRVSDELFFHFRMTFKLATYAMGLSLLLAVPLGVWSGIRPFSLVDNISATISSALVSMPAYVLGAGLIILFAIKLRWLPAAGFTQSANLILPSVTLALGLAPVSSRIIRTATMEVKTSVYVTFARIKGLPGHRVFSAHGLKNGAVPVVTFLGLQLAHVLDGVVVLENLFDWPGIGNLLLEAIVGRDLPIIQGATLLIGLMYVTVNMAIDMICIWLDPRRREQKGVL